jgi:DHA1 family bicyclomycin/chloramphenicol resistance-like MFS transporter
MSEYFSTDYRVMQLSVALYLAGNAVLQIVVGPISDRYGRRPVLLWGIGIFLVATVGCILAPTIEIFLAFRMLQAVVVVGLVLGRAVVRDMYPQDQAASQIGYVTMGMAVVPMIGPAIGGVLDETLGWQANFWMLAILGVLVLVLTWRDLGETAARGSESFAEQFAQYPELFASRRFWGYCLTASFASGAFFAFLGGAPYVGSEVFGLSASLVGLYFGTAAVGYFVGSYVSGRYSMRVGINGMVLWGSILSATGPLLTLLLFLLGFKTALVFFGLMTIVGIGNGMVLPNATSGMLSVRPHLAGTASGLGGAITIGGGAALSALTGALLTGGNGAYLLILIMLVTSLLAVGAILYTIRRERQVTGI